MYHLNYRQEDADSNNQAAAVSQRFTSARVSKDFVKQHMPTELERE